MLLDQSYLIDASSQTEALNILIKKRTLKEYWGVALDSVKFLGDSFYSYSPVKNTNRPRKVIISKVIDGVYKLEVYE